MDKQSDDIQLSYVDEISYQSLKLILVKLPHVCVDILGVKNTLNRIILFFQVRSSNHW